MDEVGLQACGLYKTLPGRDCTFPGLVLDRHIRHTVMRNIGAVYGHQVT